MPKKFFPKSTTKSSLDQSDRTNLNVCFKDRTSPVRSVLMKYLPRYLSLCSLSFLPVPQGRDPVGDIGLLVGTLISGLIFVSFSFSVFVLLLFFSVDLFLKTQLSYFVKLKGP